MLRFTARCACYAQAIDGRLVGVAAPRLGQEQQPQQQPPPQPPPPPQQQQQHVRQKSRRAEEQEEQKSRKSRRAEEQKERSLEQRLLRAFAWGPGFAPGRGLMYVFVPLFLDDIKPPSQPPFAERNPACPRQDPLRQRRPKWSRGCAIKPHTLRPSPGLRGLERRHKGPRGPERKRLEAGRLCKGDI